MIFLETVLNLTSLSAKLQNVYIFTDIFFRYFKHRIPHTEFIMSFFYPSMRYTYYCSIVEFWELFGLLSEMDLAM